MSLWQCNGIALQPVVLSLNSKPILNDFPLQGLNAKHSCIAILQSTDASIVNEPSPGGASQSQKFRFLSGTSKHTPTRHPVWNESLHQRESKRDGKSATWMTGSLKNDLQHFIRVIICHVQRLACCLSASLAQPRSCVGKAVFECRVHAH